MQLQVEDSKREGYSLAFRDLIAVTGKGTQRVRPHIITQAAGTSLYPSISYRNLGLNKKEFHQDAEQRAWALYQACGLCRRQDLRSMESLQRAGMRLGMEKQALRVKSEDTCHILLWTLMPSVIRQEGAWTSPGRVVVLGENFWQPGPRPQRL